MNKIIKVSILSGILFLLLTVSNINYAQQPVMMLGYDFENVDLDATEAPPSFVDQNLVDGNNFTVEKGAEAIIPDARVINDWYGSQSMWFMHRSVSPDPEDYNRFKFSLSAINEQVPIHSISFNIAHNYYLSRNGNTYYGLMDFRLEVRTTSGDLVAAYVTPEVVSGNVIGNSGSKTLVNINTEGLILDNNELVVTLRANSRIQGSVSPYTAQFFIDDVEINRYKSPEEMIAELITSVDESDIHEGTKNSLTASLENALKSLGKGNTGAAINQLQAFINKVEAQSGKKIDKTAADQWIAEAQEIIDGITAGLAKSGDVESLTSSDVKPETYSLNQNYPNPFNPTTSVGYSIPSDGYVTLSIYDALGKEVAVLDNGFRTAGNYSHTFDASNLSSGMYFYTIRSGNFVQTKKMLLMK